MTFLTPAGLETRHGPNIPIANPSRRSARPNRDTNRSNTASVGRRHSAAYRMARDPGMPLTDIQWVLGHAHLSTTQQYLTPLTQDVIASVLAFHDRQREPGSGVSPTAAGYRAESLKNLFGGETL